MKNSLEIKSDKKRRGRFKHPTFYVGEWDCLSSSQEIAWNKDGDCGTSYLMIIVESNLRRSNVIRAIEHTLRSSPCGHEHDCCGCVSSYVVNARHFAGNRYCVEMSYIRNI